MSVVIWPQIEGIQLKDFNQIMSFYLLPPSFCENTLENSWNYDTENADAIDIDFIIVNHLT